MTAYFVDTSALLKRYVQETGSQVLNRLCSDRVNGFFISEFTGLEITSSLNRRFRSNMLSDEMRVGLRMAFEGHERLQYVRVRITRELVARARALVVSDVLRPADAIQLASALFVRETYDDEIVFLCADDTLNQAAQAAGFSILNPLGETPPSTP